MPIATAVFRARAPADHQTTMNQPAQDPAPNAAPEAHPSSERKAPQPKESHAPQPVDLASESIAGEEDPGASIDLALGATAPAPPQAPAEPATPAGTPAEPAPKP
jgi:hypothetical protein